MALAFLVLACVPTAGAAADAPATAELTALVRDFLAGVSRNDAAVHERFWADDLVYTRAAGERIGKADILRDVRESKANPAGEPATTYTAEDVRVQQYGDTAVVAFRLVAATATDPPHSYLDTGTFVKRNGRWQAVAWQATRAAEAPSAAPAAAPAPAASPSPAASAAPPAPGMAEFFLVLLKKGPAWTAERTDATRAIQEGHMANIRALWQAKKLVIAGPMGDDGDTRGVFVFQAASRAEALALTEQDPAVKAGRLVPEVHSWWVEKRALPEAGAYCRP